MKKIDLIKAAILNDKGTNSALVRAINRFNGDSRDEYATVCAFAIRIVPTVRDCYSWAKISDMEVLEAVVSIVNEVEEE